MADTLLMARWTARVRGYLGGLCEYWRDIIITCLGVLFLIAVFLVLYPVFWYVPPALRYLLMVLLPITFVTLSMVTLSFRSFDFDWWGSMYDVDPSRWVDFRIIYGKYRKYLLLGAAVNMLYFVGLGVYLLRSGDGMEEVLSSLSAGIPILISWIILNCALFIASGITIYLSETSSGILPALAPLIPGLGQVMKGEILKGEAFLLGVFLGFFLQQLATILMGVALWLYSIYDAWEVSRNSQDESRVTGKDSGNDELVHVVFVWILGTVVLARWYQW